MNQVTSKVSVQLKLAYKVLMDSLFYFFKMEKFKLWLKSPCWNFLLMRNVRLNPLQMLHRVDVYFGS